MTAAAEAVASAFQVLQDPRTAPENRLKADAELRRWVLTAEAWQTAEELLSNSPDISVRLYAATSLRSKILYDITQLSEADRFALRDSVLTKLQSDWAKNSKPLFTQLGVSFADISVHLGREWKDFVDALIQRLNTDPGHLLLCLKFLPEENMNERLLCDPAARDAHADTINANFKRVVETLEETLRRSIENEQLQLQALECFEEWITFALDCSIKICDPFSGVFYETCCRLLHSQDPQVVETTVRALGAAATRCSSGGVDSKFANLLLLDVVNSQSPLRRLISLTMPSADQEEDIIISSPGLGLELSRIVRDVAVARARHLATSVAGSDPVTEQILSLIVKLTSLPYDMRDENSIRIVNEMLDFWKSFFGPLQNQRRELQLLLPQKEPCLAAQNALLEKLLGLFINQCMLPDCLNQATQESDIAEWKVFREEVIYVVERMSVVCGLHEFLMSIIKMFISSQNYKFQEACLAIIATLSPGLSSDNSITTDNIDFTKAAAELEVPIDVNAMHPVVEQLTELLCSLPIYIDRLPQQPMLLNYRIRVTAFNVIESLLNKLWIYKRPNLLATLMDWTARTVFDREWSVALPATVTDRRQYLEAAIRHEVATSAAATLAKTYFTCGHSPIMKQAVPKMISLLKAFHDISDECFLTVLEGVCVGIKLIEEETVFCDCAEELCKILVTHLIDAKTNERAMLSRLDRLSYYFQTVKQNDTADTVNRRKVIFEMYRNVVWPVMSSILAGKPHWADGIEKTCRVAKHAMRSVGQAMWESALAPLAERIVHNSEQHFLSSYLYVVEWLIVYHNKNSHVIQSLFDTLTERAADILSKPNGFSESENGDDPYLGEDYYGILSRYLRYCPNIICHSPALRRAFNLAPAACLQASNVNASSMCAMFIENAFGTLFELSSLEHKEDFERQQNYRNIEALRGVLAEVLPSILQLIFIAIQKLPHYRVVEQLGSALSKIHDVCQKQSLLVDIYRKNIDTCVDLLPSPVIASESHRRYLINAFNGYGLLDQFDEVYTK